MSERALLDPLGRTPIASGMKKQIADAFRLVEPGRTGALLVFVDSETKEATAQLAAKYGDTWKVAGGARLPWDGEKPSGWVGVMASWGGKKD